MTWRLLLREITFRRVAVACILLAGFYLLLVAFFEFFQHLPYMRFLLLCALGLGFLVITFLLRK